MFSKICACLQDTFHNCSFVGCATSVCQANQAVSLHERTAARFWLYSRQLGWLAASQTDLQPRAARPKRTLAEYEKMLREMASDKACLSCRLEIIVPYLDRTGCCAAPCVPCGSKFNACHVSFLKFLQRDAYSKRRTPRSSAMMICICDPLGADLQMTSNDGGAEGETFA